MRHLLYIACTHAQDYLLVTSVNPASEFMDDLKSQDTIWARAIFARFLGTET